MNILDSLRVEIVADGDLKVSLSLLGPFPHALCQRTLRPRCVGPNGNSAPVPNDIESEGAIG